jgi:predicted nucleic acid-binding protein
MIVDCFLDTNILLYAASRNPREAAKKEIAIDLIARRNFGLSAQVMQEFYFTATRKAHIQLSPSEALEWIKNLEQFPCSAVDVALVKNAAATSARYRISYWDAAILAAAEALGAPLVYSEDLNHGQYYGEVQIVDPFRTLPQPQGSGPGFHEDPASPLA